MALQANTAGNYSYVPLSIFQIRAFLHDFEKENDRKFLLCLVHLLTQNLF